MIITKKVGEPRPEWLMDEDITWNRVHYSGEKYRARAEAIVPSWGMITQFEIPDDHPYAMATAAGLTYWGGGEEAPRDLDPNGSVMFRDGYTAKGLIDEDTFLFKDWRHLESCGDIIGYTRKPSFDPSKPVQTRDGHAARIICTDRKGDRPIVALVDHDDCEFVICKNVDGTSLHCDSDLINIPERYTETGGIGGALVTVTFEDDKPISVELA